LRLFVFIGCVDATDNRGISEKKQKVKNQGGTARKNLSAPVDLRFELVPHPMDFYGAEAKIKKV
jgi:hypothetical protein